MKLPAYRAGLLGHAVASSVRAKEISFILCPLTPPTCLPAGRQGGGLRGTVPLKRNLMGLDVSKEIQRITKQIIEKYKPDRIILFGSAARGELKPDSDADFLIIKKETPLYGADRIRQLSQMIDRNIPVDLLIYRPEEFEQRLQMGDPFLKTIIKEGKTLYG